MLNGIEVVLPADIEKRSFEIITSEIGDRELDELMRPIITRVIHTTADFEYLNLLKTDNDFINKFSQAIKDGADIVTDTRMAWSGISKPMIEKWQGRVHCYMDDSQVAKEAVARKLTRAAICMERAAALNKKVIVVVGNAPTALIRLFEMYNDKIFVPEAIIGVPVGFVNVVESKELIMKTNIPYIVSQGRKGGSNVAAAIVNALLRMVDDK